MFTSSSVHRRHRRRSCIPGRPIAGLALALAMGCLGPIAPAATPKYSYRPLVDPADLTSTAGLFLQVNSQDASTGKVVFGAGWKLTPTSTFTFDWGDGTAGVAGLPATHFYPDLKRNYVVTISATFSGGIPARASVVVHFAGAQLTEHAFDPALTVTLPAALPALVDTRTGRPGAPGGIEAFSNFAYSSDRAVAERVASSFAAIEYDLVNHDVYRYAGGFNQIGVHNTAYSGGLSYWYTSPASLGIGDGFLSATQIGWGTFAHEMAHNFSINSPATYRNGGRNDGNGSGLFTECISRIFEYSVCHLLANNAAQYGLPDDLAADVFWSEYKKMAGLKLDAQQIAGGQARFAAWNDPATDIDEAYPSIATLAWTFFEQTDPDGANYRTGIKRIMWFFEHWSPDWIDRFDARHDTQKATLFRSTLMSAAISYGVNKDLRAKLRGLGFPIDDTIWNELLATVGDYPGDDTPNARLINLSTRARVSGGDQLLVAGFVIADAPKRLLIRAIGPGLSPYGVAGALPAPSLTLFKGGTAVASSLSWSKNANADAIRQSAAGVGAFALAEGGADAALLVDLEPGAYTAQISSADGRDGVAMVEVYEVSGAGRLINLSTRAQALAGADTLIPGFVITGGRPKNLLIRCAGPTLAGYGLTGVLPRPAIALYKGATVIAANAGWSTANNADEIAAAARTSAAFPFSTDSADAALFVSVPPGSYTVVTGGDDGRTGIALVEVYDLDATW